MDRHVLRKMSWRLPALADIAVLRSNTRATPGGCNAGQGPLVAGELGAVPVGARVFVVKPTDTAGFTTKTGAPGEVSRGVGGRRELLGVSLLLFGVVGVLIG